MASDSLSSRHPPTKNGNGETDGPHESSRCRSRGDAQGRCEHRVRHSRRRDQPAVLGDEEERRLQSHPRPPRRRRLAHGRRLHPRQSRQHRRVHRHVRPRRHGHDHRAVLGLGRLHPHPVHHRPGTARPSVQGGLPGRRHRVDRQARHQVGGDRARAGAGAARVPAGLPRHALRPPRPGADRPALRRADGRDRVRPRHLRAATGLQARRHPRPGREGDGDAERRRASADRVRRRRDQRQRRSPAAGIRRAHRRAGDSDPDGLGHDPRRPSADGRHGGSADLAPLRQCHPARRRLRVRHRQPLGQPPHRLGRGLYAGAQVRAHRHRTDPDRPRVRPRLRHRVGRRRRARPPHRGGARDEGRRAVA